MKKITAFITVSLLSIGFITTGCGSTTDTTQQVVDNKLDLAIAGSQRSAKNKARDIYRNPKETLEFFGFNSSMTVVELAPGGGWYTEILAPALKGSGKLYGAHYPDTGEDNYYSNSRRKLEKKLAENDIFSEVVLTDFTPRQPSTLAPAGTADLVLTFRNLHNWQEEGVLQVFKDAFNALKPGGVLGVVEHRLAPGVAPVKAKGYVAEATTIKQAKAAGFRFVAASEINANSKTTFKAIVQRYVSAVDANENGELDDNERGDDIGIFEADESELIIEGYVVSSDKGGNFFEELIIQNYPDDSNPSENPRLGFKVEINVSSLYNTYEFGRKVYIKMNGLAIGESNGVLVIGKPDGTQVGQIQAFEFQDFIMRSAEVVEITPKVTAISDLTELDENTFIQLDDVQINRNQLDKTFAGDVSDEFDGFRTLESCSDNSTLTLQTSTFADFKSLPVPQFRGGACFVAGTPMTMSDGSIKKIEEKKESTRTGDLSNRKK